MRWKHPKLGIGALFGLLWSIFRWGLADYGYLQTARDLFANRGAVASAVGYVLLSPVSGIVIGTSCVVAFVWRVAVIPHHHQPARANVVLALDPQRDPIEVNGKIRNVYSLGIELPRANLSPMAPATM